jgi:hypothetical protein
MVDLFAKSNEVYEQCKSCGDDMLGDIGYGIIYSEQLRDDVIKTLNTYNECIAENNISCKNYCADDLFRALVSQCDQYKGDSFKNCVNKLYRDNRDNSFNCK